MQTRATIPGTTYDTSMSVAARVRKIQSVMSGGSATEASLIQAINAAEGALPDLARIARDARRLLNEVRSREGVS